MKGPNQLHVMREDVHADPEKLLEVPTVSGSSYADLTPEPWTCDCTSVQCSSCAGCGGAADPPLPEQLQQ